MRTHSIGLTILIALIASKPVDGFVKAFPKSLPGAHKVQKISYTNSAHCLIHIRNFHRTPNTSRKAAQVVERVRKDINKTLIYFKQSNLFDTLYAEGRIGKNVGSRVGIKLHGAERRKEYEAAQNIWKSKSIERYLIPKLVLHNRENALLHIISDKDDKVAVTVYGGFHDWANNIRSWNRSHPEDKFSLIEITPTSYYWNVIRGLHVPKDKQ